MLCHNMNWVEWNLHTQISGSDYDLFLYSMTLYDITMSNDVARDTHYDITMNNDIAICTYHITLFYDILPSPIMIFLVPQ